MLFARDVSLVLCKILDVFEFCDDLNQTAQHLQLLRRSKKINVQLCDDKCPVKM